MWLEKNFEKPLTAGTLRELVNSAEFSKYPDNHPIRIAIDLCRNTVEDPDEQPCDSIRSMIGDEQEIIFYNYI